MPKKPKPACLKWLKSSCGIHQGHLFKAGVSYFWLPLLMLHFAIVGLLLLFLAILL